MDKTHKSISPADVVAALLRCWKETAVCAFVLALMFSLGGLAWGSRRMADTQARQDALAAYEQAMIRYHTQKNALEAQLDALTDSVQKQREYLDNSLLMALDAYDFYEGTVWLQLHTDYQILPGMTYQDPDPTGALRDAYAESLKSGALLQAMAQAVGQDVRYMAELLVIHDTEKGLSMDVRYANAEGAGLLLEQVKAHLDGQQAVIGAAVAEHTATVTDMGVAHRLDASLAAAQQAKGDKLTETVKTFNTVKTRQSDLVMPTLKPNTWSAVGKRILLLAALGFFLGAGAYLSGKLWLYSGGNRILSAAQMEEMGVKVLGFDRGEYTVADLKGRLPRGGKLLITGSLAVSRRRELAEALSRAMPEAEILCLEGIDRNVEALEALQSCDRVLLAEKRFVTPCSRLQAQKQLIEAYGKELIGCLLLDGANKGERK